MVAGEEQPQTWHHGIVAYTDEEPDADTDFVIFIARKPA